MEISGNLLIGNRAVKGTHGVLRATAAATGEKIEPEFGGATLADLELACSLADAAFDVYRETTLLARAAFLEQICTNILALGDALIERCMTETGLPRARLEGERNRTIGQLRMFANAVRAGDFIGARLDPAQPERQPMPRVDLRLRRIPVGPVAVFGASNFPLAFSVAGGDTASALAAGCPVIVKAHSAHPGTAALVGSAIQQAVMECAMPIGTFSLLFDSGRSIGQGLVADRRIKAAAFTGSRSGGVALMDIAAARAEPIPVYAEMSSINPVVLFEGALTSRAQAIGKSFAEALVLGAGQFCTNPGLVLAVDSPGLDTFIQSASAELAKKPAATMLTPSIHASYVSSSQQLAGHPGVHQHASGAAPADTLQAQAMLFETDADTFLSDAALRDEVFGATSLIVRCASHADRIRVLQEMEGQLTVALHIDPEDYPLAQECIPVLEKMAGRLVFNGFGTGVEVGHAMVHGGPYPSTSDTRTTSVGSLAIDRFLRPVSYQDLPEELAPAALAKDNRWGIRRLIDGRPE